MSVASGPARRRRAVVIAQPLEPRRLFSVIFNPGFPSVPTPPPLDVYGTGRADLIELSRKKVNGTDRIVVTINGKTKRYLNRDYGEVIVYGRGGDDRILDHGGLDFITIHGEGGRDRIASSSYNARLAGGSGDDLLALTAPDRSNGILVGNEGNDTLRGGLSDDTLSGDAGADVIDGGGGDLDVLAPDADSFYASSNNFYWTPVSLSLDGLANDGHVDEGDNVTRCEVFAGSGRADTFDFRGATAPVRLANNPGGADRITGSRFDDHLAVGDTDSGQDDRRGAIVFGGAGDDRIYVRYGRDSIYGEAGDDTINSDDARADLVDGGAGDDTIVDDGGRDTLIGGDGDDSVTHDSHGLDTPATLRGGAGRDTLVAYGDAGDVIDGFEDGYYDGFIP